MDFKESVYDLAKINKNDVVGIAEKALCDNNEEEIQKALANKNLSYYDKIFAYLVRENNVSPEMLRMIFHDGGIVYGDCLRSFLLNEKVDDKSVVTVIISTRLFKNLRNRFRDKYLFCHAPISYEYKKINYHLFCGLMGGTYNLNSYCIVCRNSRKRIMILVCVSDSKKERKFQMRLENEHFRAIITRLILLQEVRYDMNRVYYYPGSLEIVGVRKWTHEMDHKYDVEFFKLDNKSLTVFGLRNIDESMRCISIKNTYKYLSRGYYLLDVYWASFFNRYDVNKYQRCYLINQWRKNNKEFFRFFIKKLNFITDPITIFLEYLVEWELIVDWVSNFLANDGMFVGNQFKNKYIEKEKNLVEAINKYEVFHQFHKRKNLKFKIVKNADSVILRFI